MSSRVPNGSFCKELVDLTLKPTELKCHQPASERRLDDYRQQTEKSPDRRLLETYLNKPIRVQMSDGRILIGIFWCTDCDANVILGNCMEHLPQREDGSPPEEPRPIGLAMVPGIHIVSIHVDVLQNVQDHQVL